VHALEKVHGPPAGPGYPTLHVQLVTDELELGELEFTGHVVHTLALLARATSEYAPAGHAAQLVTPVTSEYVPALQSTHKTPDTYCPSRQVTATHTPSAVAPVTVELFPAAQAVHPFELLTPVTPEYLPAAHFIHELKAIEPVTLTYVPNAQFTQDVKELKIPVLPAGHAAHADMPVTAA